MNFVDHILVHRLSKLYDPFPRILSGSSGAHILIDWDKYTPQETWLDNKDRTHGWNIGSIVYFRNLFLKGGKVDPIEIDNDCNGGHIYGPIMTDGHHRFCGAILAK